MKNCHWWSKLLRSKNSAFTLIELLLVISIIGLLAAVVLGSLASARDKARLAKALQFDVSVRSALGDTLDGEYLFDEENLNDSSGLNNHGVQTVGSVTYSSEGVNGGKAVVFDNNVVTLPFKIPSNSDFTVTGWFRMGNQTNNGSILRPFIMQGEIGLADGNTEGLYVGTIRGGNSQSGKVRITTGSDEASHQVYSETTLNDNKWHSFVFSRRGSNNDSAKLYIDGNFIGESLAKNHDDSSALGLGGDANTSNSSYSSRRFVGELDNIRIYLRGLD